MKNFGKQRTRFTGRVIYPAVIHISSTSGLSGRGERHRGNSNRPVGRLMELDCVNCA